MGSWRAILKIKIREDLDGNRKSPGWRYGIFSDGVFLSLHAFYLF